MGARTNITPPLKKHKKDGIKWVFIKNQSIAMLLMKLVTAFLALFSQKSISNESIYTYINT